MKLCIKKSRKIDFLILISYLITLHRGYFYPGILTRGDWGFGYKEELVALFSFPSAWRQDVSISTMKTMFTHYPILIIHGFLAKFFGLNFSITERILLFFPVTFLPALSMYYLTDDLFKKEKRLIPLFSAILYSSNVYILCETRTHLTIAMAYSLAPLVFKFFVQSLKEKSGKKIVLTSILFAISMAYEARITYITAGILIYYLIYVNVGKRSFARLTESLKTFYSFILIFLGLGAYWVFPYLFGGGGEAFSTRLPQKPWISWMQFIHSLNLAGPGYRIIGEMKPFAVYPLNPIFFILPIFAFSALLLRKKDENVIFFTVLALIGVFLVKQENPPFGFVYTWLFMNFPGFNFYREASKFFLLTAFGYSILFGITVDELTTRIKNNLRKRESIYLRQTKTKIIIPCFLLLNLMFLIIMAWPAIGYQMQGEYYPSVREPPEDYLKIKNFIVSQPPDFKTVWLPGLSRFSFYSTEYPTVPIDRFSEVDKTILSSLICPPSMSKEYVAMLLALWNVEYVIITPENELNPSLYRKFPQEKYVEFLERQEGLRRVHIGEGIYVYENTFHTPSKFFIHDAEINDFRREELIKKFFFEEDTENWSINAPSRQRMFLSNISYQGEHSLGIELYSSAWGWSIIRSPLIPASCGNQYKWQFYIKGENAHGVHQKILTYNSKRELIASYYYGIIDDGSFDWKKIVVSFIPTSPNVSYIQLQIWHGHETDKPLPNRIWVDNVTFNLVDSLEEKDRSLKDMFFSRERPANIIEYKMIAPTKYIIRINAVKPFMITFPETYDPNWSAMVNGREYTSVPCFMINGFFIEQTGYLEIVIEYKPQVWFNYGSLVSITTLISSIIYLSQIWLREKREKIYLLKQEIQKVIMRIYTGCIKFKDKLLIGK